MRFDKYPQIVYNVFLDKKLPQMIKKIQLFSILFLFSFIFSACNKDGDDGPTSADIKKNIGESQMSETKQMNEKVQDNIQLMFDKKQKKQAAKTPKPQQQNNMKTAPPPSTPPVPPAPSTQSKELSHLEKYSQAIIHTNLGAIQLDFYPEKSPETVNNFFKLAAEKFYDGIRFHRIIDDFMIQVGDPNTRDPQNKNIWGQGGPGYTFADEINDQKLIKGSLAMANSGPNTNGSQFFIVTKAATPWLDGKHTNFGFVSDGMDVVEKIEKVQTNDKDQPIEDVIISSIDLVEK